MLTPEQIVIRRTGLGSSDLADIVLGNGLRTWLEKTGRKVQEEKPKTLQGRQPILWGNRLEPVLLAAYAEETGAELTSTGTLRHPGHPLALASPDSIAKFASERVIVESKTAGLRVGAKWDDNGIPDGYQIQGQWLMGVAGAALGEKFERCDYPVLIGGQDFQIRRLARSQEDFDGLLYVAEKFWVDHVVADKEPHVDGSDEWSDYLAERFPREKKGELVEATEAAEAEVAMLRAHILVEKNAKASAEACRNRLRLMIGEAEGIRGLCTWKFTNGSTYTTTRKPGRTLRLAKEE